MYTADGTHTQLTFHYINGQSESFNIFVSPEDETRQDFQLEVRRFLQRDWWVINLTDQTVMINVANVVKVEVRPTIDALHGDGVFTNAERITALNRSR